MRATFITFFSGLSLLASALIFWLSYQSLEVIVFLNHGGFIRCGTPLAFAAVLHLGFAILTTFPLCHVLKRVPLNRMNFPMKGLLIIAGVAWELNAYALWFMRHWLF